MHCSSRLFGSCPRLHLLHAAAADLISAESPLVTSLCRTTGSSSASHDLEPRTPRVCGASAKFRARLRRRVRMPWTTFKKTVFLHNAQCQKNLTEQTRRAALECCAFDSGSYLGCGHVPSGCASPGRGVDCSPRAAGATEEAKGRRGREKGRPGMPEDLARRSLCRFFSSKKRSRRTTAGRSSTSHVRLGHEVRTTPASHIIGYIARRRA